MRILRNYISSSVISTILLVFTVFLGLTIFITFVTEMQDVGKFNYGMLAAFQYVMLSLITQVYQLFPTIALVGCLVGLGMLASRSELMVMRASGVSKLQIGAAVCRAAIVLVVFITVMGEVAGPVLQQKAVALKNTAESSGDSLLTKGGLWARSGNDFVYIQQVINTHSLRNITLYKFKDDHQLQTAIAAQRAVFANNEWTLYSVKETKFSKDQVKSQTKPSLEWKTTLTPKVFKAGVTDPTEMQLPQLWQYIQLSEANGLNVSQYSLLFWKRVFQPLATIIMMLLAVPFVFGSMRSVTMGMRILLGIMAGLGFFILNELLGRLSLVIQMPTMLAALLPMLLFLCIGLYLMSRTR